MINRTSLGLKFTFVFSMLLMGLLALWMFWFATDSYQQLAFEIQTRSVREQLKINASRLTQSLFKKQESLANKLKENTLLSYALTINDIETLIVSISKSILDFDDFSIKSILIRDSQANLIAAVYDENGSHYTGCPVLLDQIRNLRSDLEKSVNHVICTKDDEPISEVMVPVKINESFFYIHVNAYLSKELTAIDEATASPVTIQNSHHAFLYQSINWGKTRSNQFSKPVVYNLYGDDNAPALIITSVFDQSDLMQQFQINRFNILVISGTLLLLILIIIFFLLWYLLKPLRRVKKSIGEVVNDRFVPLKVENLPPELIDFALAYNKIITVLDDTTDQHYKIEKDLRAERDFISKTLNSITNSVVVVNSRLIIKFLNPSFEQLMNERQQDLIGYSFSQIIFMYTDYSLSERADFETLFKNSTQQIRLFYPVGEQLKELEMSVSPMLDVASEDVGFVLIIKDVTEEKMLRRQLKYQSSHDKLTGLLNRKAFENKFEEMVEGSGYSLHQHVFVYINLDGFNFINQSCGSEAGDSLLKQVADILRKNIRKSDLSACLGSDEFALILTYSEVTNATTTVNNILANICKTGFTWNDIEYQVTASSALLPFGRINDDFSDVLSRLVTACGLAKEKGGNQYYLVDENDKKVEGHLSSLSWIARINKAFVDKRFKLYAQPVVSVLPETNSQIYEILIRYQADDGQIISPQEFLGAAQKFNLIDKIDRWVISEVIHFLTINPHLKDKVQFSINLSSRSVGSTSFYNFLEKIFQTSLVDTQNFCFEINEAAIANDLEKSLEFINKINTMGVKFILDNFGSGLSSLTYLQKLPIDYLKIDGLFIDHLLLDNTSVFINAIVKLGHSLGMQIIAERVETAEVLEKLLEAGVDFCQGAAIQNPAAVEEIDYKQVTKLDI